MEIIEKLSGLYETIVSNPLYIAIAAIIALVVVISVVKKLFKMALIVIAIAVLYIGYLYYTGQEIPKNLNEFVDDVAGKAKETSSKILDNIDTEKEVNRLKKQVEEGLGK